MNKNSMTLEFKVNKQHLDRLDKQKIVEKSENYLYAHFTFSSDWDGLKKYMLIRPLTSTIEDSYKLELDEDNKCHIPFALNMFPGFIVGAYGEGNNTTITTDNLGVNDEQSSVIITTDNKGVDVYSLGIDGGSETMPIQYITSNNKTIKVIRQLDVVDIGIDQELEYDIETCTLSIYAITYDGDIKERTLLSNIVLSDLVSVKSDIEEYTFKNITSEMIEEMFNGIYAQEEEI